LEWPSPARHRFVRSSRAQNTSAYRAYRGEMRNFGDHNNQDNSAGGKGDWLISRHDAMRQV